MKIKRYLWIVTVTLAISAILLLAACESGVSQKEYDTVVGEKAVLANELELVEAQIEEASDYAQFLVSFFGHDQDDVQRMLDNLGDTHLESMLSSGMSLVLEEGMSEYEFMTRAWIFETTLSEYIATKVVETLE